MPYMQETDIDQPAHLQTISNFKTVASVSMHPGFVLLRSNDSEEASSSWHC